MLQHIDHIALSVPDLAEARRFYIDLLGMKETYKTNWKSGNDKMDALMALSGTAADVMIVKAGNIEIEFFQFNNPKPAPAEARTAATLGYTHFAIKVEGIDEMYRRLVEAGVVFHTPPYVGRCGRTLTYFRDPFGNIVELVEGELNPPQNH